MKKILLISGFTFLLLFTFMLTAGFAQKKGKIHIKVTDDTKKIDTIIEFKDDINEDELKEIVQTLTGEEFDVSIDKKGRKKMIWISDEDMHFDFDFDLDVDWDDDSMSWHHLKGMKDFDAFDFEGLSDSLLTEMNIKMDSQGNYIFTGEDQFGMHWNSGDTLFGENIFIMKGDSIFTNLDSLIKVKGNDHLMIKHLNGKDEEIIMKIKSDKNKDGKYIMKTKVYSDDSDDIMTSKVIVITDDDGTTRVYESSDADEDVTITKDGKKKVIRVEIEEEEEKELE